QTEALLEREACRGRVLQLLLEGGGHALELQSPQGLEGGVIEHRFSFLFSGSSPARAHWRAPAMRVHRVWSSPADRGPAGGSTPRCGGPENRSRPRAQRQPRAADDRIFAPAPGGLSRRDNPARDAACE